MHDVKAVLLQSASKGHGAASGASLVPGQTLYLANQRGAIPKRFPVAHVSWGAPTRNTRIPASREPESRDPRTESRPSVRGHNCQGLDLR